MRVLRDLCVEEAIALRDSQHVISAVCGSSNVQRDGSCVQAPIRLSRQPTATSLQTQQELLFFAGMLHVLCAELEVIR